MAKKTTRTSQQQRARQEQWRRRIDAQTGQTTGGGSIAAPEEEMESGESYGTAVDAARDEGYQQANIQPIPSVATASGTRRNTSSTGTGTRAGASTAVQTPGQKRALAATRSTRARLAMNTMSIEEEMHYVRADIRKLITLTIACLVIIVVLAFVLNR
jgi:hypothetical protein